MNQSQIINKQIIIDEKSLEKEKKIIKENSPKNAQALKTGVLIGLVAMSVSNSSDRIVVNSRNSLPSNKLHIETSSENNIYQYNGEEFVTVITPKVPMTQFEDYKEYIDEKFKTVNDKLDVINDNMITSDNLFKSLFKGAKGWIVGIIASATALAVLVNTILGIMEKLNK